MRDRNRQLQVQHLACAQPKLTAAHKPPRMNVAELRALGCLDVFMSRNCAQHSTAYDCHLHHCGLLASRPAQTSSCTCARALT